MRGCGAFSATDAAWFRQPFQRRLGQVWATELARPPDRIGELGELLEREPLEPPFAIGLGRLRVRRPAAQRADRRAARSPVLELAADAQRVEVPALRAANLDPSLGEGYRGR